LFLRSSEAANTASGIAIRPGKAICGPTASAAGLHMLPSSGLERLNALSDGGFAVLMIAALGHRLIKSS
jgi:hypothetical protein